MPEGEDVIEVKNGKAKREGVKVPSSTVFLFFYSVLQYSRVGTGVLSCRYCNTDTVVLAGLQGAFRFPVGLCNACKMPVLHC